MFRSFLAPNTSSWGLGLGLVVGLASAAFGQRPARVEPGSVATASVVVDVPASAEDAAVPYRIVPADGALLYVPEHGTVEPGPDGARIAITFTLAATFPAGLSTVAEVRIDAGDEPIVVPLEVEVLPRRSIGFKPGVAPVQVSPGRWAEIELVLENRGNAPDTVELSLAGLSDWDPTGLPSTVVLATTETRPLTVRLRAPESAIPGQRERLVVLARGSGNRATAERSIEVVPRGGFMDDLVLLPGTITLAAPVVGTGDGALGAVALKATGEVAPGIDVDLNLRHLPASLFATTTPLLIAGSASSLEVQGADWSFGVGSSVSRPTSLLGRFLYGPGVHGSYAVGRYRVEASAGGTALLGGSGERRAFQLGVERGEAWGRVGLTAGLVDARRWYGMEATPSLGSAGLDFEYRSGTRHLATGEAGWLWTAMGDAGGSGLVADLSYRFSGERLEASSRVRRVPGLPEETAGQVLGNQFSLWTRYRLTEAVGVYANTNLYATPLSGTRLLGDGTRSAAAGLNWRIGRAHAQLGGSYQTHRILSGGDMEGVLAIGRIAVPIWLGEFDLNLGSGTTLGNGRRLDRLRAAYSLRHPAGRSWAAFSKERSLWGERPPMLELGNDVRYERLDIRAGSSIRLRDGLDGVMAWITGEYRMAGSSAVLLTARYRPWLGERMEISAGYRARLGVPLPIRRSARSGILFEDRNGNGLRDPDEPGLRGVRVSLGRSTVTTGADGVFAFPTGDGRGVQVDASTLPPGFVVSPNFDAKAGGKTAIPVVRPARVRVIVSPESGAGRLFERDLAGIVVRLVDGRGRVLAAAAAADGTADFESVVPGGYRVEVVAPGRAEATSVSTLDVTPGGDIVHRVTIPEYRRTIEIQDLPPAPGG